MPNLHRRVTLSASVIQVVLLVAGIMLNCIQYCTTFASKVDPIVSLHLVETSKKNMAGGGSRKNANLGQTGMQINTLTHFRLPQPSFCGAETG